jgi:hypothetical protein
MNAVAVIVVVLVLAVLIALAVVNGLKGKWWMATIFGHNVFGVITAIRLAKPGSWWDCNRSSPEKRLRSAERFSPTGAHGTREDQRRQQREKDAAKRELKAARAEEKRQRKAG